MYSNLMYIILPEIDFLAHFSAPSAMSLLIEEIFFPFFDKSETHEYACNKIYCSDVQNVCEYD
jgi:hypothetical protein